MNTAELRNNFHVPEIFKPGQISMTYCHDDRLILGGIAPGVEPLTFPSDVAQITGTDTFLQRRELGLINVGGPGLVFASGERIEIAHQEGLYIGKGTEEISFASEDASNPAKFYFCSAPAHQAYPNKKVTLEEASPQPMGEASSSNKRVIYKYVHPDVMPTCQLLMGLTRLDEGSVWNTMPCHTHDRRMEAYFYFDMAPESAVVHLMGKPDETRHLIMRNEEAVISPSWSIHSGAGIGRYGFIWAMAGENQSFADMDFVPMSELR
jgi:4-deoxy-L-threo-5-hexosulose-uronate ketol-isomerase